MSLQEPHSRHRSSWALGAAQALPIAMGYIPIAIAYGVLARQAGLSMLNTILMSIVVYAGSAQLIAVGLFAAAVPGMSLVLTTLIVNLRHVLFSTAISPYLSAWRRSELAFFAYELTDETFAVHSARFAQGVPPKPQIFAANLTAQLSWVLGSAVGAAAGQAFTGVRPWALDYTLPALFIALLVMQINTRSKLGAAALAGLLALAFTAARVQQWSAILATLIAATAGAAWSAIASARKRGAV